MTGSEKENNYTKKPVSEVVDKAVDTSVEIGNLAVHAAVAPFKAASRVVDGAISGLKKGASEGETGLDKVVQGASGAIEGTLKGASDGFKAGAKEIGKSFKKIGKTASKLGEALTQEKEEENK